MTNISRQEEIQAIHKKHKQFYELLGGTMFLMFGIAIGALWFGSMNQDYHMNLFTEGIGIAATVFIINRWYASRDRERLKRRLIREAGSYSNDIAMNAVEQLGIEGWLTGNDGALRKAHLEEASLQKAKLNFAKLQEAVLDKAKLHNADLNFANLQGASLNGADLHKADLLAVNLQGSFLMAASLKGADLRKADLQEAYLFRTNLLGSLLQDAKLKPEQLKSVILPDGKEYTVPSDTARFTDPSHPKFQATLKDIKIIRIRLGFDPKDPLNEIKYLG